MELKQILQLIDAVSGSSLDKFEYEENGSKLSLEKGKEPVIMTQVAENEEMSQALKPSAEIQKEEKESIGQIVKSPLVGTFYAAPAEDADPFVKTGDKIKQGQVLWHIVEAMKLMNDIESEYEGEIAEIYVENGQSVEYGQPLFRII